MKRPGTILTALILLLAACGSGQGGTGATGQLDSATGNNGQAAGTGDAAGLGTLRSVVLGRTLDRANELSSGRFEGRIELAGNADPELPGTLSMTFSGAFDEAAGASEMTIDMSEIFTAALEADPEAAGGMGALFAEMFDEPMQVIAVDDKSWIKWDLLAMFGVEDKWLQGNVDAGSSVGFGGLGASSDSPVGMLEDLADANADVQVVGQEEIRGVTTTHHRAELDLARMATAMSTDERAEFEASFNGANIDGSFLLDLWLGDDDLLHRFHLAISDLPPSTDSDGLESMTFAYDIWDHGVVLAITPPPADEVITEDELGFSLEDLADLAG